MSRQANESMGVKPQRRGKRKRRHCLSKERRFRENWVHQEAACFDENMVDSPMWLEAFNQGVVQQRLDWVRVADPDRENWLPLFVGDPGAEARFVFGNRVTLEPKDPGECDNATFGSQEWERELESMFSQLDMDSDTVGVDEFWGGLGQQKMASEIVEFVLEVNPEMSKAEVVKLFDLMEVVKDGRAPWGKEDAIEWGGGFELPDQIMDGDAQIFEDCKFNWQAIVNTKRKLHRDDRLSKERVSSVVTEASGVDKDRLKSIADGFKIEVDPRWKSNHKDPYIYPSCAPNFTPLQSTVLKLWYEDWKKGFGFFMTSVMAKKLQVNCSKANWAVKANKAHGRAICNLSSISPGMEVALNTEGVKEMMRNSWGEIRHPTIETIVRMILAYHRDHPQVKKADLELWMVDLSGAFTLLDVKWEDVRKLGVILPNGLVWVPMVGIFGWTGMPFIFDVVTRVCRRELTKKGYLKSYSNWYCDDGAAIGSRWYNSVDIEKTIQFIETLFGSKAVNREKLERGRVVAFVGYVLNLNTWTVGIKSSNLMKTLRCFFSIDVEVTKITLKMAQRLGSLASRYGKVVPYFMPFVRALWDEVKRRFNWGPSKAALLSDTGKVAVNVIRSFLVASVLENEPFTRSLNSFEAKNAHTVICEYDASLSGIGIIWFTMSNGREIPVASGSWNIQCMAFESATTNRKFKSANQNRAEFLAGIIAIIGILVLKLDKSAVLLRGDSKSALSWAYTWRFNGESMLRESMLFMHVVLASGIQLVAPRNKEEHVKGVKNIWADSLSRRWDYKNSDPYSVSQINASCQKPKDEGGTDTLADNVYWVISHVLDLCQGGNLENLYQVGGFWRKMRRLVASLRGTEYSRKPCAWSDRVDSLVDKRHGVELLE